MAVVCLIKRHSNESGERRLSLKSAFLLLGFFVCPTDQAPSPNLHEEKHSWNCTPDKIVKGDEGERLTIVSRVNPVDRCYFQFTHEDEDYRCCYQNKDDNYCGALEYQNGPKCLKSDNYFVEIDSKGHSAVHTCNLTIPSVSSSSSGKYQSFNSDNQAIQMCHISAVRTRRHVQTLGSAKASTKVLFLCIILLGGLIACVYGFFRNKRDKTARLQDEDVFEEFKAGDRDNFTRKLGKRSILSLRDSNYNNIYHIASFAGLSETMRAIVFNYGELGFEEEEEVEQLNLKHKRTGIFMKKPTAMIPARMAKCLEYIPTPFLLWPRRWANPTTSLNSRNKDGDTPLMIAAGQGQTRMVQELIYNGADVKITNRGGFSALHAAAEGYTTDQKNEFIKIVQLLQEKGLTLNEKERETVLQMFVRLGDEYRDTVEFLLDLDPTWKEDKGETLKTLYNAVAGGSKDILQLLLTHGRLEWKEYNGDCLKMAVEKMNRKAVDFLLRKTDPLPSIDEVNTALHLAKETQAKLKTALHLRRVRHIINQLEAVLK